MQIRFGAVSVQTHSMLNRQSVRFSGQLADSEEAEARKIAIAALHSEREIFKRGKEAAIQDLQIQLMTVSSGNGSVIWHSVVSRQSGILERAIEMVENGEVSEEDLRKTE